MFEIKHVEVGWWGAGTAGVVALDIWPVEEDLPGGWGLIGVADRSPGHEYDVPREKVSYVAVSCS